VTLVFVPADPCSSSSPSVGAKRARVKHSTKLDPIKLTTKNDGGGGGDRVLYVGEPVRRAPSRTGGGEDGHMVRRGHTQPSFHPPAPPPSLFLSQVLRYFDVYVARVL